MTIAMVRVTNRGDALVRVVGTGIAPGRSIVVKRADWQRWRSRNIDNARLAATSLQAEFEPLYPSEAERLPPEPPEWKKPPPLDASATLEGELGKEPEPEPDETDDLAERIMTELDMDDASLWTKAGPPKASALPGTTAEQRRAAWERIGEMERETDERMKRGAS